MEEQGFESKAILPIWKQRGWMEVNEDANGIGHGHRIRKDTMYCYRLTRKGISEALGDESLMQKNLVSDFAFEVAQKIRTMLPNAIDPDQMRQLKSGIDSLILRYGSGPLMPVMNQGPGLSDIFGGESNESSKSYNPFTDCQNH